MALQHWQNHCHTCKRPTLHVRNDYDTPHVGHLVFFCFLALYSHIERTDFWILAAIAAIGWLGIWLIHAIVNGMSAGPPYVCNICGSKAATGGEGAKG